ncbi:hypothetical protein BGZ83_004429 [Gryganskiella cystojenkinii]|nr:hypothetical protein BGZ83_004429 [Gryganskiella cystojenkinii]
MVIESEPSRWTIGRAGVSNLIRTHCRFLESIEVRDNRYCSDRALQLQQLFLEVEEAKEEEDKNSGTDHDKGKDKDRDRDRNKNSDITDTNHEVNPHNGHHSNRELDLSSLKQLLLSGLSLEEDERLFQYLFQPLSSSSSLSGSHHHHQQHQYQARIPILRDLALTFGDRCSRAFYDMTSLGLFELLNAFATCRSWSLQGLNITKRLCLMKEKEEKETTTDRMMMTLEDMDAVYGRSLERLSLEYCRINIDCLTWLLDRSPNMKDLTLLNVGYGDAPVFSFGQSAQEMIGAPQSIGVMLLETLTRSNPGLRSLHLLNSLGLQPDAEQAWVEFMATHPRLEELTLCNGILEGYIFKALIQPVDDVSIGDGHGHSHRGLIRLSLLHCIVYGTEPIQRWLTSPSSARLVVLDLSGTVLDIKNLFGNQTVVPSWLSSFIATDYGWTCVKTLEVLKLTLKCSAGTEHVSTLSSTTTTTTTICTAIDEIIVDECEDLTIVDRVCGLFESFIRLKTLSITGDSLPLRLIMKSDPVVVDRPIWPGSSSGLPSPSSSLSGSGQYQACQRDYPSSASSASSSSSLSEAKQLLKRFPNLSSLIMKQSLDWAGRVIMLDESSRRKRDPSSVQLMVVIHQEDVGCQRDL